MVVCILELMERSQLIDVSNTTLRTQMSPLEQRGQPMQPANGSTTQTGVFLQIAKEEKTKTAKKKSAWISTASVAFLGKPAAGAPITFLYIFNEQCLKSVHAILFAAPHKTPPHTAYTLTSNR